MSESYRLLRRQCKLVVLGDQCVGKTSIITQFTYGSHENNYQATVGVDYLTKNHRIDEDLYRLQLWDTAGQERFRCLVPTYIRGSSAAIIVYDITNIKSFNSVKYWIDNVRIERGSKAVIFLVGNKSDLAGQRAVTTKDGKKQARDLRAHFCETSVKKPETVLHLFNRIVEELPEPVSETNNNNNYTVDITHKKKEHMKNTKSYDFFKSFCNC